MFMILLRALLKLVLIESTKNISWLLGNFSLLQVAKMFNHKIKMIPKRPGERWSSKRDSLLKSKRDLNFKAKYSLYDYIKNFLNHNKKD